MTRPGSPPSRGRHSAPEDGARPDEDTRASGRHAAPDAPPRRHAGPDAHPPAGNGQGVAGWASNGWASNGQVQYSGGAVNGHPGGAVNGHPARTISGHPGEAVNGHPARTITGHPGLGRRRHAAEDTLDGHPLPDVGPGGRHAGPEPAANGSGGVDGFGYRRPEPPVQPWPRTNGYHLEDPAPPAVNGYRLDEPVAPVTGFPYTAPAEPPISYPVNGHGLDAAERQAASWVEAPAYDGPAPLAGWRREPFRPAYPILPREDPPPPAAGPAVEAPSGRALSAGSAGPSAGDALVDRPAPAASTVVPRAAVVPLDGEATQALDRPAPAAEPAGRPPHPPRAVVRRRRARRKALEWPFLIVFALVSAFLIRQYVVQTFFIPSASMHETLIEGDRVLVNKVGYHLHDVHRGDVVVFAKPPTIDVDEDDLIKRVVALPGETVEGHGGKVYVNGAPLDEPYVEPLCNGTGEFAKVTVPAGKLWVMGDNRCNSSDSRVFGPIDQNLVVGRAFVLAWPFGRLSWL